MASLGQIIFYTMIVLIVIFAAFIILILALAFSGSHNRVHSTNTSPIGNLSDDVLLSCYLNRHDDSQTISDISVTWKKEDLKGLVYKYENGATDLTDQNSQFKGRTLLFLDELMTGNASLLLKGVRNSDRGKYTCSITYSEGFGDINVNLRTAAFSAPTFTLQGKLAAEANWWFPKPNVTWSDFDGNVLQGDTSFTQSSSGIFSVVSTLQLVNISGTYTCSFENSLLIASSWVTITGSNVSWNTHFADSTASPLLPSAYLITMISVLCIHYLT